MTKSAAASGSMGGLVNTTALRWVALAALVLGTACKGPKYPCQADGDCSKYNLPVAATCDQTSHQCVAPGNACLETCGIYQDCVQNQCVDKYARIDVQSPAEGAFVNGTGANVVANLVAVDGGQGNEPSLLLTPTPGAQVTMTRDPNDGLYRGHFTPGAEGHVDLKVSMVDPNTGPSKTVGINVDLTPPGFVLAVAAAPARSDAGSLNEADPASLNAWRRDETARITAVSDAGDVQASSVRLVVVGVAAGGDAGTTITLSGTDCGGGQGFCQNFDLDMSKPQLQAFRGAFGLNLVGADRAGNVGDAGSSVPVTRWKWVYNTNPGPTNTVALRVTPAIGKTGRLYFGTDNGSSSQFIAVNSQGGLDWSQGSSTPVLASPAVSVNAQGQESVYWGSSGSAGTVYLVSGSDGGTITSCTTRTGDVRGGLAVETSDLAGQPIEAAVAVLNSTSSSSASLIALQPGTPSTCLFRAGLENISFGTGIGFGSSTVVVNSGNIYYGDNRGMIRGFQLSSNLDPKPGWPVNTGLRSLALALASGNVIGGGNSVSSSGAFSISEADGGIQSNVSFADQAWNPVVNSTSTLIGVSDNTLKAVVGSDAGTFVSTGNGYPQGAPALGEGGIVYVANSDGTVQAFRTDIRTKEWELTDSTRPGPVEASVSLDCTRNAQGTPMQGRPGVLYVASNNGHLYAFIVDSRGLDTTAPWPKYQHDPQNTGNARTTLDACP